jgi:Glycosyl transferase family 2
MLSVIIPVNNIEKTGAGFIRRFNEALGSRTDVEVFFVENGIRKASAALIARELEGNSDGKIKLLQPEITEGEGAKVLFGLKQCMGDVLAWATPDIDIHEILIAYESYRLHNDPLVFVKGIRKGQSFTNSLNRWWQNTLLGFLLEIKIRDVYSGPKIFSRDFYNKYLRNSAPNDTSINLYAVYWASKSGRLIEVDINTSRKIADKLPPPPKPPSSSNLLTAVRVIKNIISRSENNLQSGFGSSS